MDIGNRERGTEWEVQRPGLTPQTHHLEMRGSAFSFLIYKIDFSYNQLPSWGWQEAKIYTEAILETANHTNVNWLRLTKLTDELIN